MKWDDALVPPRIHLLFNELESFAFEQNMQGQIKIDVFVFLFKEDGGRLKPVPVLARTQSAVLCSRSSKDVRLPFCDASQFSSAHSIG